MRFHFKKEKSPIFIFISKSKFYIIHKGEKVESEKVNIDAIIEAINENISIITSSNIILWVEFPWMISMFKKIIPLSWQDTSKFIRNSLNYCNHSPEKFIRVGCLFIKIKQPVKTGALCVAIPPHTIELMEKLKELFKLPVEVYPLVYSCLNILMENNENGIIFQGIEQLILIEKAGRAIKQMYFLPQTIPSSFGDILIHDYIDNPLLMPEKLKLDFYSSKNKLLEETILYWEKHHKSMKDNFIWERENKYKKLDWKYLIYGIYVLLICAIVLCEILLKMQFIDYKDQLNKYRNKLLAQTSEKAILDKITKKQNYFNHLKNVFTRINNETQTADDILRTIKIFSDFPIWIHFFKHTKEGISTSLLTYDSKHIPEFIKHLEKYEFVESVILDTQKYIEINKVSIVEFTLKIKIK